jgi:iron complex outermembrane receptor protein
MTLESITASDVTNSATISDEWYDPNKVNPYYGIIPGVTQSWNWLYLIEDKKEDFSQELRLTSGQEQRLRWTVGGSYLGLQVHFGHVAGDVPLGEPLNLIAEPDGAHTYAGFGGIYYDLLPPLELGAEGRYQSDQIYSYLTNTTRANGTFTSFSPRFTVKYKLDPTTAVYALWSRGVLPGAFNTQLLPGAAAVTPAQQLAAEQVTGASPYVKQETLETEELGIKSQFLDGRGFLTFDVYAGKLTNEQVSDSFTVLVPGNPVPYVGSALVNQGAVDINGVEAELQFQVTPEFRVSANYALNNTKITAGPDTTVAPLRGCSASVPSCIDVDGNRLPNAPKNQGDITAQYTRPLNATIRWYAGADYIYVGTKFAETANLLSTGAQELVNARLGLMTDTWKIEAWGKNINNNKTPELVSVAFNYNTFVGNAVEIALPQKPTYGVRVTYKFQ